MNANGYRKFLEERNISTESIDSAIAVIESFETALQISNHAKTADTATREDAEAFSEQLICEERNTFGTYLALLKYGVFVRNRALYVTVLEFLDGAEAFGNLHTKLADAFGWQSIEVNAADQLIPALEQAFAEKSKPSLVIVPVDYDENMKLTKRLGEIIAS